ncbi:hypothetical protein CEXT_682941 [Caerostris extrusa]|uniref:Uncharacterized protein n=1 Tax=Caerostris extrusa TaxID=172846 RepID=A0AAV4V8G1_CAEEX|nr:hypothetical protein CEXT_682941 [Caerostris extrusa]
MRFYNFLGNTSDFPFFASSRNGYSFLVCLQQLLGGYAKIFAHEKLYCLWVTFHPLIVLAESRSSRGHFW